MNAPTRKTDLQNLRTPEPAEARMPSVTIGFNSLQSFELTQRIAKMFSASTLVPPAYRAFVLKWNQRSKQNDWEENPSAMSNCAIALSIADRMHADPLMVMQNLHIIEGRPSWSSVWIIASINQCGRFEPLRFDMTPKGPEREVVYEYEAWEGRGDARTKVKKQGKVKVRDRSCIAWTVPKGTVFPPGVNTRQKAIEAGMTVFESTEISIELALAEGWLQRNGSKWQTMSDQMLVYRSASFFGRVYAPELLLGLPSEDEVLDILEAQRAPGGQWTVPDIGDVRPPASGIDEDQPGDEPSGTHDGQQAGATVIDAATGEVMSAAEPTADAPTGSEADAAARQAFEDACKLVQSGQYDDARAICPGDQMAALEKMIEHRETDPQAAQAAQRASRRGTRPAGGVE